MREDASIKVSPGASSGVDVETDGITPVVKIVTDPGGRLRSFRFEAFAIAFPELAHVRTRTSVSRRRPAPPDSHPFTTRATAPGRLDVHTSGTFAVRGPVVPPATS